MVTPLNQNRDQITVRLELQLKEGQDGHGPEIDSLRAQLDEETGVVHCDSGTGFMTDPPTRDFGWQAKGETAAEFYANVISSVMERRGYEPGSYRVTLYNARTSVLTPFGAKV
jgi:hypothetical protein